MIFDNCVCLDVSDGHKRRITGQTYNLSLYPGTNIKFLGGYPLSLLFSSSLGIQGKPLSMCSGCYARNKRNWEKNSEGRCMPEPDRVHMINTSYEFIPLIAETKIQMYTLSGYKSGPAKKKRYGGPQCSPSPMRKLSILIVLIKV